MRTNAWTNDTIAGPHQRQKSGASRLQGFRAHRKLYQEARYSSWEGRLCGCSQDTKSYCIYSATPHNVVESREVVCIETTSKVASPAINETDYIDEMDNVGIIEFQDGPEDDE